MTMPMNILFEQLFYAWCSPHGDLDIPDAYKGDPTKAYGLYAFEEGFKLALSLAFLSLDKAEWGHP